MRALNMQALGDDIRAEYPGVVVYGIGDEEHQLRASDHNEDDTAGSRPAQSDADSNPEHRAIDVMIGPAMPVAQLQGLVERVVAGEQARERAGGKPRLFYVIFNGWIWSRSNNWVKQPKTDDPHPDHAHFSGWAAGDEIAERWPAVSREDAMNALYDNWPGDVNDPDGKKRSPAAWIRDLAHALIFGTAAWLKTGPIPGTPVPWIVERVALITAKLTSIESKITAPPPVEIDYDKLAAALVKAGIATRADVRDAVADLGEGGAAQVRS